MILNINRISLQSQIHKSYKKQQMNNTLDNVLLNQQKIIAYVRANHTYVSRCFNQISDANLKDTIKVQKVFDYLKTAFSLDGFQFRQSIDGNNFFVEENREQMEKLLEKFYITYKKIPKEKFFFYRMTITQEQVADLIEFWIRVDLNLYVQYEESLYKSKSLDNNYQTEHNGSDLSFHLEKSAERTQNQLKGLHDNNNTKQSQNIKTLEKIQLAEQELSKAQTESQKAAIQQSIAQIKSQMQRQSHNLQIQIPKHNAVTQHELESFSPTSARSYGSIGSIQSSQYRQVNLRIVFDFYAKQGHYAGLKSTFERIEHQSSRLNYPEFVHFLKQFKLQPENMKQKPNIFQMFQKNAANYKQLQYREFQKILTQLSHIFIQQDISDALKQQKFFQKIFSNQIITDKNIHLKKKSTHRVKAFHTKQSHDFRIKPQELKYKFQISPHSGKLIDQIQQELIKRRQFKQKHKLQVVKKKQVVAQKFLKKLSNIDPFHSSLINLKQPQVQKDQIVGISNLEAFRDVHFNPRLYFKIQDDQDDSYLSQYSLNRSPILKKSEMRMNHQKQPLSVSTDIKLRESQIQQQSPTKKHRSNSIAQQIVARAAEITKIQKEKNSSIIKNILNHNQKKVSRGMEAVERAKK